MTAICQLTALVSVSLALGQDPAGPPKQEAKKDFNPAAVGSLVPEKLGAELRLNEEQRRKVDVLEQEFHKQRKAALTITMMKVQTIMDKIEREEEPAPVL